MKSDTKCRNGVVWVTQRHWK